MTTPLPDITVTTEPSSRQILVRRLVLGAAVVVAAVGGVFGIGVVETSRFPWPDRSGADAQVESSTEAAAVADEVAPGSANPGGQQQPAPADDRIGSGTMPAPGTGPALAGDEPPPSAAHDRFTLAGGETELDVLANDAVYGDVELTIIDDPTGGRLVLHDGRLSFSADGFIGDALFTYRICSEAGCDEATAAVVAVPDGASRLEAQAPVRVLDTRSAEAPMVAEQRSFTVDGQPSAIAVSVSVAGTTQAGEVVLDAGAGPVVATRVGGSGAMTTNTVILRVAAPEVSVSSTAGGHLVVDIVGTFRESGATAPGRFVPTGGVNVGQLVTAQEGRTATFDLDPAVAGGQASAVLALVTADVGADGGMIRLGQEQEAFDQMLMWGPPASDDRLRQGLVLLVPSADNQVALRYDGGSVLNLDVLGYFTTESAEPGYDGLLVATEPTRLFDGTVPAGELVTVDDPTGIGGSLFVLERSSGRTVSTVLPTSEGRLQLGAGNDRELSLDLLAVFL